jgi:hypothetical protein
MVEVALQHIDSDDGQSGSRNPPATSNFSSGSQLAYSLLDWSPDGEWIVYGRSHVGWKRRVVHP